MNNNSNSKKKECNYFRLLLCYYYISASSIHIITWILSAFGILLTIIGLYYIPFYIDSNIYRIFFVINIPYFITIIIFNIVYYIFRRLYLMNDSLNLWGYGISIVEIYFNIFGIITNTINDIMIFYNIDYYEKSLSSKKSNKLKKMSNIQIICPKIILPIIFIIWINSLLLAITNNILIYLKINSSCYNYKLSLAIEDYYNKKSIVVIPQTQTKKKKPKKNIQKIGNKNENKDNDKSQNEQETTANIVESINPFMNENKDNKNLPKYEEKKN